MSIADHGAIRNAAKDEEVLTPARYSVLILTLLWITGCASSWVPIHEINNANHPVDSSLSDDQIKQAILGGARDAGWQTEALQDNRILATYHVRDHTVHVEILYTDWYYKVSYKDSDGMKIYCNASDRDKHRKPKVSGRDSCFSTPHYIHGNFKAWVDSLNAAIAKSLASI